MFSASDAPGSAVLEIEAQAARGFAAGSLRDRWAFATTKNCSMRAWLILVQLDGGGLNRVVLTKTMLKSVISSLIIVRFVWVPDLPFHSVRRSILVLSSSAYPSSSRMHAFLASWYCSFEIWSAFKKSSSTKLPPLPDPCKGSAAYHSAVG